MNIEYKNEKTREKMQYWRNPANNIVYETYGQPGLTTFEESQPILDLNQKMQNVRLARDDKPEKQKDVYLDSHFAGMVDDYIHAIRQGGAQKQAALHSSTNAAVDIVNIFGEVFGKLDRVYAGKNVAREIPVPNLVIEIDSVTKYTGMTRIGELQLPAQKQLPYRRESFTANKYGLQFEISEESQLKNVHNVLQDSIQVAGNKIEQQASYDVIEQTKLLPSIAASNWGAFDSNTDHSTTNPLDDILTAVSQIEGAGAGGKADRIGMTLFTNSKFVSNTNIRGVASSGPATGFQYEPGTREMLSVPGVGQVLDNGFGQGNAIVTSVAIEPAIVYFQGPQRVGSKHNEITGSDEYFIIDYHLAALLKANTGGFGQSYSTGFQLTGVSTPVNFAN